MGDLQRFERPLLVAGLIGVAGLLAAATWWARAGDHHGFGAGEVVIAALVAVAAVLVGVGVVRERPALRIYAAAGLSLGPLLEICAERTGVYQPSVTIWEHPVLALLAATVCTVGAFGLVRRCSWARWLAFAGAGAGLGTSGLNGLGSLATASIGPQACMYALIFGFCGVVGLALLGSQVRAEFAGEREGLWASSDPIVRGVRATVLTQLVALPMLVVYALVQPIVSATAVPALLLAALLGLSALACMARKLAGALGLALGGPALLLLTGATAWLAHAHGDPRELAIVGYYACFWLPAGVIATVTGAAMIRPLLGLWRRARGGT
jgi:hypothetical protein